MVFPRTALCISLPYSTSRKSMRLVFFTISMIIFVYKDICLANAMIPRLTFIVKVHMKPNHHIGLGHPITYTGALILQLPLSLADTTRAQCRLPDSPALAPPPMPIIKRLFASSANFDSTTAFITYRNPSYEKLPNTALSCVSNIGSTAHGPSDLRKTLDSFVRIRPHKSPSTDLSVSNRGIFITTR